MTICLGKSCSFGLLCSSFVGICQIFPFVIEGRMWDVSVLIPNHCLSIYFSPSSHKTQILKSFKKYINSTD